MKNRYIYLFIVFTACCFLGNAQDKMLKTANKNFKNFNYPEAIKQYEELLKKGVVSSTIYQNLGDANYLNAKYEEAAKYYQELLNFDAGVMDKEHMYRYALCLRSIKKYEDSDKWIERLNALKMGDLRGKNLTLNSDYLEKIRERLGSYSIENISVNSEASDFAPSFGQDDIVFASARDTDGVTKDIHNWNKANFLDLYTTKTTKNENFGNPTPFSKKLNTKMHESSTVFTKDGKTVYFTRNNQSNGNFSRDKEGVSRLQLFKAELINGRWGKVKALPFNADHYSVAHPALSENEDKLYFSSDMPGTLGDSDIFVVDIKPNNSYGIPKNLGNKINTESKETFPFVEEGILYFASDGHPGLGGMDIFAVDFKNLEESLIVNLGEPINSISDDFSFIYDSEAEKGYFASDRIDGKGSDDIYFCRELKPLVFKDKAVIDSTTIIAPKVVPIGIDLANYLDMEPIYFDLNKWFIRDDAKLSIKKVIGYMKKFPEVKVKVGSHTDSRSSDEYNESLSAKRAAATVKYIVSQGIEASRISGEGFGEKRLLNGCSNGVICSKEEHQINRRSEFIVVK